MSKKIIWIDMDGVLVDLQQAIDNLPTSTKQKYPQEHYDLVHGLFRDPPVYEGAKWDDNC